MSPPSNSSALLHPTALFASALSRPRTSAHMSLLAVRSMFSSGHIIWDAVCTSELIITLSSPLCRLISLSTRITPCFTSSTALVLACISIPSSCLLCFRPAGFPGCLVPGRSARPEQHGRSLGGEREHRLDPFPQDGRTGGSPSLSFRWARTLRVPKSTTPFCEIMLLKVEFTG